MWSGGISNRNPVRPAVKWARGLTCQTAKTPPAIYNLLWAGYCLDGFILPSKIILSLFDILIISGSNLVFNHS